MLHNYYQESIWIILFDIWFEILRGGTTISTLSKNDSDNIKHNNRVQYRVILPKTGVKESKHYFFTQKVSG